MPDTQGSGWFSGLLDLGKSLFGRKATPPDEYVFWYDGKCVGPKCPPPKAPPPAEPVPRSSAASPPLPDFVQQGMQRDRKGRKPRKSKAKKCTPFRGGADGSLRCVEDYPTAEQMIDYAFVSAATVLNSPGSIGALPVPGKLPTMAKLPAPKLPQRRGPISRKQRGSIGVERARTTQTTESPLDELLQRPLRLKDLPAPTTRPPAAPARPPAAPAARVRELPATPPGLATTAKAAGSLHVDVADQVGATGALEPLRGTSNAGRSTRDTTTNAAHPGSGSAPATQRTAGKSGTATKSAPGSTSSRPKPVVRGTPRALVLPVDALLAHALRLATSRSPKARQLSPGPGAAPAPVGSVAASQFASLGGGMGPTACDCSKKKRSRPKKRRTECWQGSYTETATGLRKTRRQQVSC